MNDTDSDVFSGASQSYPLSEIRNRQVWGIIEVPGGFWVVQVFVCRSGSAADTQNLAAYVTYYLHQHCMDLGREADVKTAAKLAQLVAYQNKVHTSRLPWMCLKDN